VIAFNTLILEEEPGPRHCAKCEESEEYSSSALTAAEALLGIINQVLDYTQMENEVLLSSNISLTYAPFRYTYADNMRMLRMLRMLLSCNISLAYAPFGYTYADNNTFLNIAIYIDIPSISDGCYVC
jgi:hypothetical protein